MGTIRRTRETSERKRFASSRILAQRQPRWAPGVCNALWGAVMRGRGDDWLAGFVRESNRIEGITRTRKQDIEAHRYFIAQPAVAVGDLVALVGLLQPNARLRDNESVPSVRVGNHIAPPSGPEIRADLEMCLWGTRNGRSPFDTHRFYETLHPFTDGNGRSGRALWLWQMLRSGDRNAAMAMQLGFLHSFYYQTLATDHGEHRNG